MTIASLPSGVVTMLTGCGPVPEPAAPTEASRDADMATATDPYLWLEEVRGDEALAWVEARNEESLAVLAADPRFELLRGQAEEVLDATDRIPHGTLRAGFVYNFWRDDEHVRGLWRRIAREQYLQSDAWETIIDLDELAKQERENWVWDGAACLPPSFERCIVRLSRAGKDATVAREFDLEAKAFVADGFALPEAKLWVEWLDIDHLLVATDFGEGTLTDSGYPSTLRVWQRGTPLADAREVFKGEKSDVAAWPWVHHEPDGSRFVMFERAVTFFTANYTLWSDLDKPGLPLPLPEDIKPTGVFQGQLIATLRSDWTVGGTTHPMGALVSIDMAPFFAAFEGAEAPTQPSVTSLLVPAENSAVQSLRTTKDCVLVELLVDVLPRIERFTRVDGAWQQTSMPVPDGIGTLSVVDASAFETEIFLNYDSPIDPESLFSWQPGDAEPTKLASLPARFDATGMKVEQQWATSKDGTPIPYFVTLPAGWEPGVARPTYLYAYGGFEVSILPAYRALVGKFWLGRGGVFVSANIRGGGEYGPRWHQAALLEHRQRAYEDFFAVSEDLIAKGYTAKEQLGIRGGSNGGLLMGVALTQRPDLFKAIIIDVPLLDMLRYHTLLAGASWMAEYGDPEDPAMREVIAKYSPYQNVDPEGVYPQVFVTTSTADDRVHPGHARKLVARLTEYGHPLYYYENTEGGHGGSANNKQAAFVTALKFVYFMRQLGVE